ncbi:MAG: T9SS type A sorting domain-containing protein [Chitinophagaceae bacterium]|nr:MAG: T9SS type A sorting domain-containing protein [Chitinophagaceae bacterium]
MVKLVSKIALAGLLFCFSIDGYCQGENNTWYFGDNAGIKFTALGPVALTNGVSFGHDGTASVSNNYGELLFYSNGETIWNKNHQVMMNGAGLKGSQTATHGAVAVQQPGSASIYYVFTTDRSGYSNGLQYHVVDMSLESGLGAVTSKNNLLQTPVTEKLTSIKHTNSIDTWVLAHGSGNNSFFAYLVTSTGISGTPVISSVGPVHGLGHAFAQGQLKCSNDGTKLALGVLGGQRFELYNFNAGTGEVLNPDQISGENNAYGVEFSSNGRYLYTSNLSYNSVHQFDLQAGNSAAIAASKILIGTATTVSGTFDYKVACLQKGPDGKIYVTKWESPYLGVINNPDLSGIQADFIDNGVYLGGKVSLGGLPNRVVARLLPNSVQETNNTSFGVNPNPANGQIKITIPAEFKNNGERKLTISDILGKEVYWSELYTEEKLINVSCWAKGLYVVSLEFEGIRQVKRLIVE